MTIEAACAYLGALDREAFIVMVAPSLRGLKLSDGQIRYDRRDLDAWVDSGGNLAPQKTDSDWLREIRDD
jgi:hypothetical protein